MQLSHWCLGCSLLLLAACGTESGGGTGSSRDGGSAGGTSASGGASGSGAECTTTADCPQTDCFGCPPKVCVNGRCTTAPTTGTGGAGGTGGAVDTGGTVGAGGGAACTGSVLIFQGDARCQTWLESNCCSDLQACEDDATCKSTVACINRCPTPRGGACLDNCAPNGNALLDNVANCSKNAPPVGAQCAWP